MRGWLNIPWNVYHILEGTFVEIIDWKRQKWRAARTGLAVEGQRALARHAVQGHQARTNQFASVIASHYVREGRHALMEEDTWPASRSPSHKTTSIGRIASWTKMHDSYSSSTADEWHGIGWIFHEMCTIYWIWTFLEKKTEMEKTLTVNRSKSFAVLKIQIECQNINEHIFQTLRPRSSWSGRRCWNIY